MPHLLRSDGKAVIFPAGCSGPDRKHGFADAWFMYADEDAFFFVAGSARTFGWHIYLARAESPACAGLRHRERFDPRQSGGLPADLFVQRTSRHSFGSIASLTRNPSPGLAHRITTSLLDAGLLWNRETGHVCEVPDRLLRQHPRAYGDPKDWQSVKIEKGNTIGVEGGYIGGLFNATLSIRATISKT
jgi:hypothetical protein